MEQSDVNASKSDDTEGRSNLGFVKKPTTQRLFLLQREPSTRDVTRDGLNQLSRLCTFSQKDLNNALLQRVDVFTAQ